MTIYTWGFFIQERISNACLFFLFTSSDHLMWKYQIYEVLGHVSQVKLMESSLTKYLWGPNLMSWLDYSHFTARHRPSCALEQFPIDFTLLFLQVVPSQNIFLLLQQNQYRGKRKHLISFHCGNSLFTSAHTVFHSCRLLFPYNYLSAESACWFN